MTVRRSWFLVLCGAPLEKVREISVRLREIKEHHRIKPDFEIKWTKVSPAQTRFYLDVMDYFFDDDDLHFRPERVPSTAMVRPPARVAARCAQASTPRPGQLTMTAPRRPVSATDNAGHGGSASSPTTP